MDEIARAMDRLLSDAELRARLGEQGKKRAVERFSWEGVARKLEAMMLPASGGA